MYRPGGYVSNPQYMPGPGGPPPYQQHYGTTPPQQQNYNYGPPANMPGQHPLMSHEINTQMHFTPNQVNHYSGNPYGMPNFAAPRPTYEQQQCPGPPTPGPPPQFSMPQAVTSHAPHMQPPAFLPVPQNFPQNYANPSYQNPQLSQHQQQQQQYPVYASQQVNSQFPNLPQVPPQAPPPEPSEEPAFSMDSAASGKLLPPPPPPPSDEEMVQNIEVLSEFVARNGPDFENMARAKENGNQKFSFLFNGAPGSDAAVGHQYYQWMKKKWELEINGQKFQHDQPGMQLESSGARQNMVDSNAAANSPPRAASDMEMDDDLAPVDPVKLKNVSPQELTHTKMAQLEEVKPNAAVSRLIAGWLHDRRKRCMLKSTMFPDILGDRHTEFCNGNSRFSKFSCKALLDPERIFFIKLNFLHGKILFGSLNPVRINYLWYSDSEVDWCHLGMR